MSMVVQHSLSAMFTERQLKITGAKRSKSAEKLASGYRVNRAADDAAGLAISEKMRKQIRGLTQASANLQDGVSLSQVADGALSEVHDMLHRVNELAIKAANGTMSSDDRKYINEEVQALKREMNRVFKTTKFNEVEIFRTLDTIYNPDVEGFPTDMGVFHAGNGGVGGLEFENVRYSIAELQEAGLKIDDAGKATEDFETEFRLWDGESVKLTMKAGQGLESAVRNYTWRAEPQGIYINDKLAAEWSDILVDGQKDKIKSMSSMPVGDYSFSYHGMDITFSVDDTLNISEMQERINGDDEILPATWDVSVGSSHSTKSSDIIEAVQNIRITEANKDVIDHTFVLVADENGLAVKDTSNGNQTAYVTWNTFKDSNLASRQDENGNEIHTNGGYPVVDWGTSSGTTGESSITFDADATYHFVSPDDNVKIEFDFKLADCASLDEVMNALNGAKLTDKAPVVAGSLSGTNEGYGSIGVYSGTIRNTFDVQRHFGRNFDHKSSTLTGDVSIERKTVSGQPSAADRPGENGEYEDGTHEILRRFANRVLDSENAESPAAPSAIYIIPEKYTDYSYDENGDKIPETDEYGNPLTDGSGNPVYKTEEYVRWHYVRESDVKCTNTYTNTYDATDTWTQKVTYTFDGTFAGKDLNEINKAQQETYSRSLTQTQKETYVFNRKEISEVDLSALSPEIRQFIEDNPGFLENPDAAFSGSVTIDGQEVTIRRSGSYDMSVLAENGRTRDISTTYGNYSTVEGSIGEETLIGIGTASFNNLSFHDDQGKKPYALSYSLNLDVARLLTQTTGTVKVSDITFKAAGYGSRDFKPTENNTSIREAEYSNVEVNEVRFEIPPRKLIIQSGADSNDQIEMTWSPLNLYAIGLSNTKTLTMEQAERAIDQTAKALKVISDTRERFGAYQNRFEHAIKMTDNTVENTTYAESRIRDTDMAKEMMKYSNIDIIAQAGQAMLAQANQSNRGVLTLLS